MDFDPIPTYLFLAFCIVAYIIEPEVDPLLERIFAFLERNSQEMVAVLLLLSLIKALLP